MNRKLWIRKALSTCLVVVTMATSSMVALAGSDRIAGELTVSGKANDGETPFVKVNGETAQNGRSIFSTSTIATPKDSNAVINFGKIGKIELANDTVFVLSFNENGISGELLAGQVTVLNSSSVVNVKMLDGTIAALNTGETASTAAKAQDDDDDNDGGGGGGLLIFAIVLGGAAAAIVIAATTDNNRVALGGNTTVFSPTR